MGRYAAALLGRWFSAGIPARDPFLITMEASSKISRSIGQMIQAERWRTPEGRIVSLQCSNCFVPWSDKPKLKILVKSESDILERLKKNLQAEGNILVAYIFGSFLEQRLTSESDVDIAVLFREESVPDGFGMLDLAARLSRGAGREVDLLCLNNAGPIIAMQVLRKGKIIVERDAQKRVEFQVRLISRYDDVKRVRLPIEKAILNGRIYG